MAVAIPVVLLLHLQEGLADRRVRAIRYTMPLWSWNGGWFRPASRSTMNQFPRLGTCWPMHFEGRKKAGQGINLMPLIDLVFLLLIFFMLTSHFVRDEAIPLELPTAASGSALADETLQVILDNRGRIVVAGEVVDPDSLEGCLQRELQYRTEKRVQIRGDKTASLESTVCVLDESRLTDSDWVDIITREL